MNRGAWMFSVLHLCSCTCIQNCMLDLVESRKESIVKWSEDCLTWSDVCKLLFALLGGMGA